MFISFFTGKVMLFYGISLIMKEKSNASALRPRVDRFLKSFRADILFYPCEVMRWPWGAETTAHRPMFADKHRDRGTKSAMCLLFAGFGDKKQALWQFV